MQNVTVVIPNFNGKAYLRDCLESLRSQSLGKVPVIVVDNGSGDGSPEEVQAHFPEVQLIRLNRNYGFSRAVNEGIRLAGTKYVVLLNNDIRADQDFLKNLMSRMESDPRIFSCQARMMQMNKPELVDDAGDFYCALGWAFARGKNRTAEAYMRDGAVFSACAGAAIYRRKVFDEIGFFDEAHFAYLEDVDVGYRARICGWKNWYEPEAVVYHKGSASSGSRYNAFKVSHASRNSIYLVYKNMARWQILINLPFLLAGCLVKFLFFLPKGLGHIYLKGLWQGILLARQGEKFQRVPENFDNCCRIQLELWGNLFRILRKNK